MTIKNRTLSNKLHTELHNDSVRVDRSLTVWMFGEDLLVE